MARSTGEPGKHGPAGAARWTAYLGWVREDIADAVLGLSEDERRRTRLPSGWTPIELLSHVLHMEQRGSCGASSASRSRRRGATGPSTSRGTASSAADGTCPRR
ncbi:mycothiol transferase [Nocardioides pyridinolyticus]